MSKAAEKRGPILVTAAVIRRGKKILIAQRKSDSKVEPLKWEFPGGKLEHGESPEQCLAREIKEELNLKIKVGELIGISSHVYKQKMHIVLLCYMCKFKTGQLKCLDVEDAKWISPREMKSYRFAAADIPLLNEVKKALKS
jgi:8-oxo-dGTP diphosphatase